MVVRARRMVLLRYERITGMDDMGAMTTIPQQRSRILGYMDFQHWKRLSHGCRVCHGMRSWGETCAEIDRSIASPMARAIQHIDFHDTSHEERSKTIVSGTLYPI